MLWLLHGTGGKERRVVTTLAHCQGYESLLRQFVFTTVGYQHFGRDLGFDFAHAFEVVQWQIFHCAAALRTDDVRAPAEFGEAVGQSGAERVSRISP
ncbi:hypothetical protein D3C86_1912850 [compost metagenome]